MKKLSVLPLILLAVCLNLFFTEIAYAQAPQAIAYQAIARDANGNTMVNQSLAIRITLIDSNISTLDYQETHRWFQCFNATF